MKSDSVETAEALRRFYRREALLSSRHDARFLLFAALSLGLAGMALASIFLGWLR